MKTQFDFRALRYACSCMLVAGLSVIVGSSVDAQLVDDYSSADLSTYTDTVILNLDSANQPTAGNPLNTAVWGTSGGALELTTSDYDGIQQHAFIKDDLALLVGQEVQLDIVNGAVAGNRNFGLYVGGTAPVADTRVDYISVYGGNNNNNRIFQRGFDGTSEYTNLGGPNVAGTLSDTLFIARTGTNTFETGYIDPNSGRVVISTLTPAVANSADFVGFYADARTNGTIGAASELRIVPVVPEPGSLALLGLASVAGLARRRR